MIGLPYGGCQYGITNVRELPHVCQTPLGDLRCLRRRYEPCRFPVGVFGAQKGGEQYPIADGYQQAVFESRRSRLGGSVDAVGRADASNQEGAYCLVDVLPVIDS